MTKRKSASAESDPKLITLTILAVVASLLWLGESSIVITPVMITLFCVTYVVLSIGLSAWHGSLTVKSVVEHGLIAALIEVLALSLI